MGLTGSTLKGILLLEFESEIRSNFTTFQLGQDVLHAGIATHYCDSSKIPDLEQNLLSLEDTSASNVEQVINDFCPKIESEFSLSERLEQINRSFDACSVEEILCKLENDGSDWAQKTLKVIKSMKDNEQNYEMLLNIYFTLSKIPQRLRKVSPTSLKVTFRQLSLGANMSLGECLQMEYRLAFHFLKNSDFHEGVRALLISKDNKPKWNPPCIEDVPLQRVQSFFQPLPDNDELPM